jgi:hypothetical protein
MNFDDRGNADVIPSSIEKLRMKVARMRADYQASLPASAENNDNKRKTRPTVDLLQKLPVSEESLAEAIAAMGKKTVEVLNAPHDPLATLPLAEYPDSDAGFMLSKRNVVGRVYTTDAIPEFLKRAEINDARESARANLLSVDIENAVSSTYAAVSNRMAEQAAHLGEVANSVTRNLFPQKNQFLQLTAPVIEKRQALVAAVGDRTHKLVGLNLAKLIASAYSATGKRLGATANRLQGEAQSFVTSSSELLRKLAPKKSVVPLLAAPVEEGGSEVSTLVTGGSVMKWPTLRVIKKAERIAAALAVTTALFAGSFAMVVKAHDQEMQPQSHITLKYATPTTAMTLPSAATAQSYTYGAFGSLPQVAPAQGVISPQKLFAKNIVASDQITTCDNVGGVPELKLCMPHDVAPSKPTFKPSAERTPSIGPKVAAAGVVSGVAVVAQASPAVAEPAVTQPAEAAPVSTTTVSATKPVGPLASIATVGHASKANCARDRAHARQLRHELRVAEHKARVARHAARAEHRKNLELQHKLAQKLAAHKLHMQQMAAAAEKTAVGVVHTPFGNFQIGGKPVMQVAKAGPGKAGTYRVVQGTRVQASFKHVADQGTCHAGTVFGFCRAPAAPIGKSANLHHGAAVRPVASTGAWAFTNG